MNQPAVFISCVWREFRETRNRVATILTRLGYTPLKDQQYDEMVKSTVAVKRGTATSEAILRRFNSSM
jgi:TnpA family transposase